MLEDVKATFQLIIVEGLLNLTRMMQLYSITMVPLTTLCSKENQGKTNTIYHVSKKLIVLLKPILFY